MATQPKNCDDHVVHAEQVARGEGFQRLRDRILELAAPRADETVVDVGAGTGLLTLALAERVERVWAIDISSSMGEYLRAKTASAELSNVEIVAATAVSLPLVDDSADLVVSNYCFHHLDDRGKSQALAEAHRVLRSGGRLVFGDMMFRVSVVDARDRRVIREKVRARCSSARDLPASSASCATACGSRVGGGNALLVRTGGVMRSSPPALSTSPSRCSSMKAASQRRDGPEAQVTQCRGCSSFG